MKRKPDAILTADWHLRTTTPICRTDDFMEVQFKKVQFVKELQKEYNCPVLCANDLFDHWKASPQLIYNTMLNIPANMYCKAGNHDAPGHSLKRLDESGINVLDYADYINPDPLVPEYNFHLTTHHFGEEYIKYIEHRSAFKSVIMIHEYVYKGRKPFPGQLTGVTALMDRLKGYDLIVVGDNHLPFTHKRGKQLLVNPGSLTRQNADQVNHRPRVYLWYAKTNTTQPVYIPIDENVISRTHIKKDKERDRRIDDVLQSIDKKFNIQLSFEDNIKKALPSIESKAVKQKIMEAMENGD